MQLSSKSGMAAFALLLGLAGLPAQAGLTTTPTGPSVATFNQFRGQFRPGPQEVGGQANGVPGVSITWSTTGATGAGIGEAEYFLGSNGVWEPDKTPYTGLNARTGTMTFTFNSGLVSSVGGFINYAPFTGEDVFITALDADGNILERDNISADAPISTPNGTNAGAFRGISLGSPVIKSFQVSNADVVLDDLTFSIFPSPPTTVPEASTTASFGLLLALGLGGMIVAAKRKKSGSAA